MGNNNSENKPKRKRAEPLTIDSKTFIELAYEMIQKDKPDTEYPILTKSEITMLTYLLFQKDPEFRVWLIKKKDKRAIREFVGQREAQRQGIPLKQSTIYFRRMRFLNNLIESKFNGAEAARKSGYSQKYAKQVAYRIRRSIY